MTEKTFDERVTFLIEEQVMEVDFSDLTFDVPSKVNAFYDVVEAKLAETGKKWFFLVNYKNCRIMAEAWIACWMSGKS